MNTSGQYSRGEPSPEVLPNLTIRLRPGWIYDAKRQVISRERGEEISPKTELPKRTRIVYMISDLADKPPETFSEEEENMARYVQIILPKGTKASEYLATVRSWECVEDARLPPEISLP